MSWLLVPQEKDLMLISALPDKLFPASPPGVHEILVRARNHLALHGWVRRSWGVSSTCLMGAIATARGYPVDRRSQIQGTAIGQECADALGFASIRDAISWNDRIATAEEVFRRLDAAIAKTAPPPVDPLPSILSPIPQIAEPVGRELIAA